MKKFYTFLFTLTILSFSLVSVQAQDCPEDTPFMVEDFSSGIPTGWTTGDDSAGGTGEWTWCDEPITASGPGCAGAWGTYTSEPDGGNFLAPTSDNGFLIMDSDGIGAVGSNHIVWIQSTPFDFTAQDEVYVAFESLIGVFEEPTLDNAIFQVSTDAGATWTNFNTLDITITERWSENPEPTVIDITAEAANQSAVMLRWSWTGNYEYWWCFDDLHLYDYDPACHYFPTYDLQINDNFFAGAINVQTPKSQVERFGFLADVKNTGLVDQENINLNVIITEQGSTDVLYTEDLTYPLIQADTTVENVLFAGDGFLPAPELKMYEGTYTISSDEIDEVEENSTRTFDFQVTENIFAKENGITRNVGLAFDDNELHSWGWGNSYRVVNGQGFQFNQVAFGIGNPEDFADLEKSLTIRLYRWYNTDDDPITFSEEEQANNIVGVASYTITGTETADEFIWIDLVATTGGKVLMEDNTDYVIMVDYAFEEEGDPDFFISGATIAARDAQEFRTIELGQPRYADLIRSGEDVTMSTTTFGGQIVPAVRLSIEPTSVAVEELSADNKLALFPNPASTVMTLSIDLTEEMENVLFKVLDVQGKLITESTYASVQNKTITYDVSNYAAGTYFLHMVTENGTRVEKFVVEK